MKYQIEQDSNIIEEKISYKDIYNMYREDMKIEDELINQRLGWLLLTNGILFAAFGHAFENNINILINLLVFIGISTSIAMAISVWAARRRVIQLDKYLNNIHSRLKAPSELFPRAYKSDLYNKGEEKTYWGLIAPKYVPLIFIIAWLAALVLAFFKDIISKHS